jgi:hypothetical protein
VTRAQGLLLAGLAVAAVAVWGVLLSQLLGSRADAPPDGIAVTVTASPPSPTAAATPRPTPTPAPTPSPTEAPPTAEPDPGNGSTDLASWLAFLARLDGVRASAQELNDDLRAAGEESEQVGVAAAAAAMAVLVDRERDWLSSHPPAACYADAHAAADDLLAAYGDVATESARWSEASGLDVLAALADVYTAVETAAAEAADIGRELEAVSCPA